MPSVPLHKKWERVDTDPKATFTKVVLKAPVERAHRREEPFFFVCSLQRLGDLGKVYRPPAPPPPPLFDVEGRTLQDPQVT